MFGTYNPDVVYRNHKLPKSPQRTTATTALAFHLCAANLVLLARRTTMASTTLAFLLYAANLALLAQRTTPTHNKLPAATLFRSRSVEF